MVIVSAQSSSCYGSLNYVKVGDAHLMTTVALGALNYRAPENVREIFTAENGRVSGNSIIDSTEF